MRIGEKLDGYNGGAFDLVNIGRWVRVEAIGVDWVVVRGDRDDGPQFWAGDPDDLDRYVDEGEG